jgi:hypothetical protein
VDNDDTPDDSKLTATKRQWAAEGKFLTGRRTPSSSSNGVNTMKTGSGLERRKPGGFSMEGPGKSIRR